MHMDRIGLPIVLLSLLAGVILTGAATADENSFSKVQRGRYLVDVGDCVACHSAPEGEYLAGGQAVPTPFGEIYSRNLTPDQETGLGAWTLDQFIRAMREGISADGSHLYPAFPYPYFTRVTEDDLAAIWSYLQTIEPVHNEIEEPDLFWPLGWRQLMSGWKLLFFEPERFEPDPDKSEQWNRGAYLVEGLGHCGACHTPKNRFGAARDNDEDKFTGNELQQWFAPNLTGDLKTGLGGWTKDDVVEYLKTGSNGNQVAAGLMREVIEKSTQYFTDDDLYAVATYLKDLPGNSSRTGGDEAMPAKGSEALELDKSRDQEPSGESGQNGDDEKNSLGRALFVDNCTGCHRYDGKGIEGVFPQLQGSPIVQQENPASLIHVVLRGAREPNTESRRNWLAMPNFDWKLDDEQIAELLTYIRGAWGNDAPAVDSETVADLREATRLEPETTEVER